MLQQQKEELIELFGQHFENLYHLSPLGSRILGNLIVDGCKSGITFEELVERTGTSKSSVSTNLNLLLKSGKITYYTITGDRKKYYRASPFSERLANYVKIINFEKEIIDKMISYRTKTLSSVQEQNSLDNTKAYKVHMTKVEELILETIDTFKQIEKTQ
ncbi:GbsR/MarR family transcriptional regulator [Flavobacterium ardleyense]|uniref:GbsR/MarR family transcriptional regulator n=1 Tax=Flavobacterium ardleyense TaxID=2038737 RepID=UPI00298BF624|nr:hypothetical protein [Flavobacterium ardleyense]